VHEPTSVPETTTVATTIAAITHTAGLIHVAAWTLRDTSYDRNHESPRASGAIRMGSNRDRPQLVMHVDTLRRYYGDTGQHDVRAQPRR